MVDFVVAEAATFVVDTKALHLATYLDTVSLGDLVMVGVEYFAVAFVVVVFPLGV